MLEGPEGLSEGPEGLPDGPEGLPEGPEGLPEGPEGPESLPGGTDVRTYGRTDVRNFSPFYRTSSPVGAAALLPFATSPHQRSRARVPLTS